MPSMPSISHAMSTAAVNLTSSPFDLYGQVLGTATANLQADLKSYMELGLFPILRQVLTNQVGTIGGLVNALGDSGKAVVTALTTQVPGYLGAAFSDLGKANVEGALNNLQLAIVLPIFAAINPIGPLPKALGNLISQPLQSMINIANDLPNLLLELGLGIISPVASTLGAVGTAVQNVINAVKAGDLGKLATAVIQAPATVVDGLLNGGYGPNLGALLGINIPGFNIYGGGLFGGGATLPTGATISGTLQSLVAVVKSILTDITPAKTPAATAATTTTTKAVSDVASVPSTTAATVTLSTAATTKAVTTTDTATDKVKTTGSTSESTGTTTEGTTKAGGSATDGTGSATGTSGEGTSTGSATDSGTKTGTSTGSTTDSGTKTGTSTGSTTDSGTKTGTSAGDTKTGSGSGSSTSNSSSGSSSAGSNSSSGSASGSDGTKTTTPGRKGHQGKSGSDSGSGAGAGSTSGSASGSDSGAKGGSAKGSHTDSKSKSKSHSAA
ncbi:hypothetical protein A7R75_00715 [Mycolicibacterium llatzerense]|nr:hypothetical protein [Mycolicibacterium llatzerense]